MLTRQTFFSASWRVDAPSAIRPVTNSAAAYRWLDVPAQPSPIDGAFARTSGDEAATFTATAEWQTFVADATLRRVVDLALSGNTDVRRIVASVESARTEYDTRLRHATRNLSGVVLSEHLATEEAAHGARIDLIAEVIHAYVTRDGAARRRRLGARLLEAHEASLDMAAPRADRNLADELEYQEAAGFVDRARADLERIDQEFRRADAALHLLVGAAARENLPTCVGNATLLVHDIAPDAPSELLTRRPDIRAAERRLRAANVDVGAARAAFVPRIPLTGLFGRGSAQLSDLLKPARHASRCPSPATLPRKDIAVAAYERAVRAAFHEVSATLAAVDALRRDEDARCAAAHASAQERRSSRARYRSGFDDRHHLLAAQRDDLANQMALVGVRTQRQLALVTLFRALGGGWRSFV